LPARVFTLCVRYSQQQVFTFFVRPPLTPPKERNWKKNVRTRVVIEMNDYKIILRFLSYLKPYWAKETVLFFLMISGSVAGLASPCILKLIIDKAFPSRDFE